MAGRSPGRRFLFFGGFKADLHAAEIFREGQKISLPEKSFQVLALLLERSGEMVSREALRRKLWQAGTYVNFDHNLNNTIARLRSALSDPSENPQFIETVASRGYRFIGNIEKMKNRGRAESSLAERSKAEEERIRLAVLPFENLCSEPPLSWLGDGFTEEVIVRLGHLFSQRLGIIARTSILKYKGTTKNIGQIGRELQVGYILEGTVQSIGDQMHISAQLIQVKDQTHLWAESYEYRCGDTLRIQNEVAEKIARSLGLLLLPAEQAKLTQHASE